MEENSRKQKYVLQALMAVAALISFVVFLYHVFAPANKWPELSENAIYWFLLSLLAIIFPYISEITFKDFHVLFKEISENTQKLVTAKNQLELARFRFDKTREELILGYFKYLKSLPEEKQIERKIHLTKLYLEGMFLSERQLMEMLNNVSDVECEVAEHITVGTLKAIEQFQTNLGLIPDGVFGYQTYAKLLELTEQLYRDRDVMLPV